MLQGTASTLEGLLFLTENVTGIIVYNDARWQRLQEGKAKEILLKHFHNEHGYGALISTVDHGMKEPENFTAIAQGYATEADLETALQKAGLLPI